MAAEIDLKPSIPSDDIVIQNTVAGNPVTPVTTSPADPVKTKEEMLKAAHDRDVQSDAEYRKLKNKPSYLRHPIKRADLWIDYHQNTYRKFRTRILPATQFAGVMIGMGFSIASAL